MIMGELAAKKSVAMLLFNGLKGKMEEFESSINCRRFRIGNNHEYSFIQFFMDKVYIKIGDETIARVSADECKLSNVYSEETEAELIIHALLALSVMFSGTLPFNIKLENKVLMAVVDDADLYWRVDSLADTLVKGFINK